MGLLAVDIGNSTTVLGELVGGEVTHHWQVGTDTHRTADEWALLLAGLLSQAPPPTGVVLSSAVPAVTTVWRTMLQTQVAPLLSGLPFVVVGPGVRSGLPVRVDNPREVGTDRIANAAAAAEFYGGPVIVVDLGVATTFDVVDSANAYVGGAIAAGPEVSSAALARRGAQLRDIELAAPRQAIARNTVEAMQSGAVFGMAALVDGMVGRMIEELAFPGEVQVIATGPWADLVFDQCRCFTDRDRWLKLRGLELIFNRNNSGERSFR